MHLAPISRNRRRRWFAAITLLSVVATAACSASTEPSGVASPARRGEGVATPPADPPAAASPTAPLLTRGAHPLAGLDPALPVSDLAPLDDILAPAEIVALGETVHTSGGYSAARARIIRYLVEHRGYRAVSFEGPWGPAEATRAFVEDGRGTLQGAMAGLTFLAWRNDVTKDLLVWLRSWNAAHPADKVRFFGFDVQAPWDDGPRLRAFLGKVTPTDPTLADATRACIGAKHDTDTEAYADPVESPILKGQQLLSVAQHEACIGALARVEAHLAAKKTAVVAASSQDDLALARVALVALRAMNGQMFHLFREPAKAYDARDLGMADVLMGLRALRAPGAKTAVWAHNRHITTRGTELVSDADGLSWHATGSVLAERLGTKYAAIGLVAKNVSLNWDGTKVTVQPPRDGADDVEKPLSELGRPYVLLDLADNAVLAPGRSYELGEFGGTGVPAAHYRALVYLETSPAQTAFF
jgi:erythromycin esterase